MAMKDKTEEKYGKNNGVTRGTVTESTVKTVSTQNVTRKGISAAKKVVNKKTPLTVPLSARGATVAVLDKNGKRTVAPTKTSVVQGAPMVPAKVSVETAIEDKIKKLAATAKMTKAAVSKEAVDPKLAMAIPL